MPKISQRHIRSWRVLCPPVDEQRRISASIVSEADRVNEAIHYARREIALIAEYRTRLIADVVTGKLDVRETAAQLPELEDSDVDVEQEDDVDDVAADEEVAAEADQAA
jgi:type I restriction enzyme S subunit